MNWSPGRRLASEPTIDASAPSARWVWPRITPGCSSNVRFTRSSNSRMRSIWVNTQTSPSRSRPLPLPLAVTEAPSLSCDARAELRARRLVGPPEDLLHREVAQLLGEHLDAPRAPIAVLAGRLDVGRHVELPLAGQAAVVDRLVEEVVHVLAPPVAQLDPAQVLRRDALEVVRRDPELRHVPRVDRNAAVRRAGPLDDVERGVEAVHVDVERHQLVDELRRVGVGCVGAELGEALGHLLARALRTGGGAGLDVMRVERGGGIEEQAPVRVGRGAAFVAGVEEPVHEELELEVVEPGRVEDVLHLAQRAGLEHVLEVGVPDPDSAKACVRRLLAAVAPVERRPLAAHVHLDGAGHGPVEAHQLDVAHRSLLLAVEPSAGPGAWFACARRGSCRWVLAYQPATEPASTGISIPVTNEASSEHSHTTTAATSAGSPNRLIACGRRISSWRSGVSLDISGVMIAPGQTALTRIPWLAYSTAAFFVSPPMPCLLAVYALSSRTARRPAFEDVLTIAPPPSSSMRRIWCFIPRNVPRRFTAMTRSKSSSSVSCSSLWTPIPALLWAKSSRPWRATTVSTAFAQSSPRATSHTTNSASPPAARIACTVSSPPARSTSATITAAPSCAKRMAQARPMPLAAPVTRPALPCTRPAMAATLDQGRGAGWCRRARSVADPCRARLALEGGVADLARREVELALEDAAEVGGVAEASAEGD